jgi:hypothetical protein
LEQNKEPHPEPRSIVIQDIHCEDRQGCVSDTGDRGDDCEDLLPLVDERRERGKGRSGDRPHADIFSTAWDGALVNEHQLPSVSLHFKKTRDKSSEGSDGKSRHKESNEAKVDGNLSIVIQARLHDVVVGEHELPFGTEEFPLSKGHLLSILSTDKRRAKRQVSESGWLAKKRPDEEEIRHSELGDISHGESGSYDRCGESRSGVEMSETEDDRKIDGERDHAVGGSAISLPVVISIIRRWGVRCNECNVEEGGVGVDKLRPCSERSQSGHGAYLE